MRVAYLGPAGTNTHDALLAAAGGAELDAVPCATVHEAIAAVEGGDAERGFVPFENSIEGAVRSTLDTLAFEAGSVTIAGEHDHRIHHALIAGRELELSAIGQVISHEQAGAQCARFLRESLPGVSRPPGVEHRGGRSHRGLLRRAVGGDRCLPRRPSSTERWSCATRSATRTTTSPGSSGSRPEASDPERRRPVAHHPDLLRAGSRSPRRAGRRADRVLLARGQPHPARVPAPPPRAGALHVLRRHRGRRLRAGRSPRRSRRCGARRRTCECSAATR